MLSIELEEMLNGKSLNYKILNYFKQAEEASGIKPIDSDYFKFREGEIIEMPMKFLIIRYSDMSIVKYLFTNPREVTEKDLLKALKAYDEKLSSLLAEHHGSRYRFTITFEKGTCQSSYSGQSENYIKIFGVIEDTKKALLK